MLEFEKLLDLHCNMWLERTQAEPDSFHHQPYSDDKDGVLNPIAGTRLPLFSPLRDKMLGNPFSELARIRT